MHSHTAPVTCLTSSSGLVVSGSADGSIRVFDVIRMVCVHVMPSAHGDGVRALYAIGETLFSAGNGAVKVQGCSSRGDAFCCHSKDCT